MKNKNYDDDETIKIKRRKKKEKKLRPVPENGVKVDFSVKEKVYNKYYLSVAGKYRAVRYLSGVLLIAFLIVMLAFFRENITYTNLMYLVRDLDTDIGNGMGVYADISYDSSYAESFSMFRTRLAVAGSTGIKFYDSTGSKEAEFESSYAHPTVETGGKYALMYDAGGKGYSIYTTVARVLDTESESEIECAAVSDSGYYALLTKAEESKYLITVYDSGFKPVTKYYKDKYVIDMALSPDGKEAAVVSAVPDSSGISCEVMLCRVGTEETSSFSYSGIVPVSVSYSGEKSLFVMTDGALLSYSDGVEKSRYDFSSGKPDAFNGAGEYYAVSVSKNAIGSENELIIFDINGNVLYNITLEQKVTAVVTDGVSSVYAAGDGKAVKISLEDGKKTDETAIQTPRALLAPEGSLIVCGEAGTSSYFMN